MRADDSMEPSCTSENKIQRLLDRCSQLEDQLEVLSNHAQYPINRNASFHQSSTDAFSQDLGTPRGHHSHTQPHAATQHMGDRMRDSEREVSGNRISDNNVGNSSSSVHIPKLALGGVVRRENSESVQHPEISTSRSQLATNPEDIAKFLRNMETELRHSPRQPAGGRQANSNSSSNSNSNSNSNHQHSGGLVPAPKNSGAVFVPVSQVPATRETHDAGTLFLRSVYFVVSSTAAAMILSCWWDVRSDVVCWACVILACGDDWSWFAFVCVHSCVSDCLNLYIYICTCTHSLSQSHRHTHTYIYIHTIGTAAISSSASPMRGASSLHNTSGLRDDSASLQDDFHKRYHTANGQEHSSQPGHIQPYTSAHKSQQSFSHQSTSQNLSSTHYINNASQQLNQSGPSLHNQSLSSPNKDSVAVGTSRSEAPAVSWRGDVRSNGQIPSRTGSAISVISSANADHEVDGQRV